LPIHTIYFGGGTPSLLPITAFTRIFRKLASSFEIVTNAEITIEANPGTLSRRYMEQLAQLGINRLSLGMQSAIQEELTLLGREHTFEDVVDSVHKAYQVDLTNVNLDLIFGIPHGSNARWHKSLRSVLDLKPVHISLYALTLEHGTPLFNQVKQGLQPALNPDLAADMYEWASDELSRAGYQQYEISNWAKEGEEQVLHSCKHNLQYWRNLPYLGLGAGAHGYARNIRTRNVLSPSEYINRLFAQGEISNWEYYPQSPATLEFEVIDQDTEIKETLMMGLRLTQEGISDKSFYQRFGFPLNDRYKHEIEKLINFGLLEWVAPDFDRLRLTPGGRLLGNQVFIEFI
jgi:putative oxygen-independent coproporphyrinogen III oxidase